jgi:prepilin-type N-terminal cleavage/methylation domain-containing protein
MSHKTKKHLGFTIIEVMMVLAVAGMIMVIVFIAVSEAGVSRRDHQRKAYAQRVFAALEDYYKSNNRFPGCNQMCGTADMQRFMLQYMPNGQDPSTGLSYRTATLMNGGGNPPDHSYYGSQNAVESSTGAGVYVDNGVYHYLKPKVGQVIIVTAHWCYATTGFDPTASVNSGDHGPPLAGAKPNARGEWDQDFSKFAILIYQERGDYYCLDDYAPSGSPQEKP